MINLVPTARADAVETLEDTLILITNVLANDSNPAGAADPRVVVAVTEPAHGSAVLNPGGTITYTPAANYSGADSFTYAIHDGDGGTAWGTVLIPVNAVNDRPSFTGGPDQTVPEDAGAVSVPGWAKNISAGPADEAGQAGLSHDPGR